MILDWLSAWKRGKMLTGGSQCIVLFVSEPPKADISSLRSIRRCLPKWRAALICLLYTIILSLSLFRVINAGKSTLNEDQACCDVLMIKRRPPGSSTPNRTSMTSRRSSLPNGEGLGVQMSQVSPSQKKSQNVHHAQKTKFVCEKKSQFYQPGPQMRLSEQRIPPRWDRSTVALPSHLWFHGNAVQIPPQNDLLWPFGAIGEKSWCLQLQMGHCTSLKGILVSQIRIL